MSETRINKTVECAVCRGLGRVKNDLYYGPLMRRKREAAGVSGRAFAKQIGLSAMYLCDLERGRRHLNEETMQKIEDGLTALGKGKK